MDIYWNMDISPILSGFILDVTGLNGLISPVKCEKRELGRGKSHEFL